MSSREQEQKLSGPEPIDLILYMKDYLQVLRKMWKRIVALIILGVLLFYIRGTVQYQPYYTASATFTINMYQEQSTGGSTSSFFDNSVAEQMATTFPYILTSGVLQRQVAEALGMSYVPGSIRAEVLDNTNLLTIYVTDIDAERAYRTLHAVVEKYPTLSEVIVGKTNMEMLDETGIPAYPDNPKNMKNTMIKGGLLGAVIGFLWAALAMVSRRTIRHAEDCPRLINRKCLGTVPWMTAKKRSRKVDRKLTILDEKIDMDFKESFRIIRNKIENSAKANGIKSILVTSTYGSEGKSTIAVNLALSLAQEEKRVALIDCDLRHPSDNKVLGIETEKGLAECLKGEININDCLLFGKDIGLPNDIKLAYVPGGEPLEDGSLLLEHKKMYNIVKALEKKMDYVILDSAPIGLLTDSSVLAQYADGALYIVKNDYARADDILEGMEHLADSKTYIIGCVLNGQ